MRTNTAYVNRDLAEDWLTKNNWYNPSSYEEGKFTNRPIRRGRISTYAQTMLRGEWRLTHQPIAFDKDTGLLYDGQHRLMALVEASNSNPDIEIPFTVIFDGDMSTFDVVDNGARRTGQDTLAVQGEANTVVLHSTLRLLWLYDNRSLIPHFQWGKYQLTNHQIRETLDKHPDIRSEITEAHRLKRIGMIQTAAAVGIYVCRRANNDRFSEFVEGLAIGNELRYNDPRLVFRNYLLRGKVVGTAPSFRRMHSVSQLAMFIKTRNDHILGKDREMIRWVKSESFPEPIVAKNEDQS